MNKELINELLQEAGTYVQTQPTRTIPHNLYGDEVVEKLVELIVKKCADIAADHEAIDIYEEILEYFG